MHPFADCLLLADASHQIVEEDGHAMLSVVSVRLLHLWLACVTPLLCLLQEGFHAEDDANANDDYDREDRDEEERRIQDMLDRAAADARAARERAVAGEKGMNAAIRGVAC